MTEQHRHVDAESEKLTDGDYVAEVANPDPSSDSDAGPADGAAGDADAAPVQQPRQ